MFCKLSATLLLVGLAAAQTSPSDQCYNSITGNVTQLSGTVLANLVTLQQGATVDTVNKLGQLRSGIQGDTAAYINNLRAEIEQRRNQLISCGNNLLCLTGVVPNILTTSAIPSLSTLLSTSLTTSVDQLNDIVNLNAANLEDTINSINALKAYIATNALAIQSCLIAEFPLIGPLLG